jgi:hypothetical protein
VYAAWLDLNGRMQVLYMVCFSKPKPYRVYTRGMGVRKILQDTRPAQHITTDGATDCDPRTHTALRNTITMNHMDSKWSHGTGKCLQAGIFKPCRTCACHPANSIIASAHTFDV